MKPGIIKLICLCFCFYHTMTVADDEIKTVPLINLENLEPSYEKVEKDKTDNENISQLKKKSISENKFNDNFKIVSILGLDKITAKTTKINIKLGESKKFGLLEIKAIKCGVTDSINEPGKAAYIQVKDLSDNNNEKVFVFNGWTFSASPSLRPLDHPVYDLWLVDCKNT